MNHEKNRGILLSLDIEAAFDSVSWSFIKKVMKERSFPHYIVKWFETLYAESFSRVLYNGHLSSMIKLGRSCRQGDALSCYLFILVMDVLANRINCNPAISGVKIGTMEVKVLMYADDTVCIIEPRKECVTELFSELGWFAKFSGLRPNLEKTQAMWIGEPFHEAEMFQNAFNLQWCESLKLLGIDFENSLNATTEIYKEKIIEIKREISKCKMRNISLIGKVLIIKALLVSKISYLFATITNPSESFIKELERVLYQFLWHGKRERIRRSTLIKEPLKGGVGMIDVATHIKALKITWIRRYVTNEGNWEAIASQIMGTGVSLWLMGHTALRKKAALIGNQFWREVLLSLTDFKETFRLDIDELSACPIFFSNVTKFKNTWIREWHEKGVRTLNDLLKRDGSLMKQDEFRSTYNIQVTFLDYHSLLQSLPAEWRNTSVRNKLEEPSIDPVLSYIVSKDKGAAHLSRKMIESQARKSENIWEKAWESTLTGVNWRQIYASLMNTPMQYRAVRYKIITRIVGTNSLLKYIKVRATDTCDYCELRENIEHKFWYCRRVQSFWNEIRNWLENQRSPSLASHVTREGVILGGQESLIINHIISTAIYMIYAKRHLSIEILLEILLSDLKSEKYLAALKEKEEVFNKKWKTVRFLGT